VANRWRALIVCATAAALAVGGCGAGDGDGTGDADVKAAPAARAARAAQRLGLTRTLPPNVRRVCDDLAAYAPEGVGACPPLVPKGATEVQAAKPFSRQRGLKDGWISDFESEAIRPVGHWRFDVTWSPAVRELVVVKGVEAPVNADGARSDCHWGAVAGQRVEACQVLPFEAGGGVNGGHVAYVWPHGPATYVVSVHDGPGNGPRARAMMEALIAEVAG
jgi:hypothetical protein